MRTAFLTVLASMLLCVGISFGQTTAPSQSHVMLVPFHSIGENSHYDWIATAIDEDLASDLSRNHTLVVSRAKSDQSAAPLQAARDGGAGLMVSGSYQVVDDQLRITTTIADVHDGKSIDELKTTGKVRDLFQLEDTLAAQVAHALPGEASAPNHGPADFTFTSLPPYDNGSSTPLINYSSSMYPEYYTPQYTSSVPYYSYPYNAYPYDYGYPFFFSTGFFSSGRTFRFHHDHFEDHFRGNSRFGFGGHTYINNMPPLNLNGYHPYISRGSGFISGGSRTGGGMHR